MRRLLVRTPVIFSFSAQGVPSAFSPVRHHNQLPHKRLGIGPLTPLYPYMICYCSAIWFCWVDILLSCSLRQSFHYYLISCFVCFKGTSSSEKIENRLLQAARSACAHLDVWGTNWAAFKCQTNLTCGQLEHLNISDVIFNWQNVFCLVYHIIQTDQFQSFYLLPDVREHPFNKSHRNWTFSLPQNIFPNAFCISVCILRMNSPGPWCLLLVFVFLTSSIVLF